MLEEGCRPVEWFSEDPENLPMCLDWCGREKPARELPTSPGTRTGAPGGVPRRRRRFFAGPGWGKLSSPRHVEGGVCTTMPAVPYVQVLEVWHERRLVPVLQG